MLSIRKLALLILPLILAGCSGESDNQKERPPTETELVQNIMDLPISVDQMLTDGDAQLAATPQGLYWRENSSAQWLVRSPTSTNVTGVVVIDSGHYIVAAAREDINDTGIFPLYVSYDSGENWELIQHNFGREFNDAIFRLAYDEASEQLYATSTGALAVSDKHAREWTLLSGIWDGLASGFRMIRIDNLNQNIWYGGQGPIENGILSKYSISENTTDNWQGLLPDPSTFRGGVIHPVDVSTVIFSGEGGIVISTDDGVTWSTPLGDVNYTFYFDVVIDQSLTLYTAQWLKGTPVQPLVIKCSTDNGTTWFTNDFSKELSLGGTLSMMIVEERASTFLYLGLEDNGIKAVDVADLTCG